MDKRLMRVCVGFVIGVRIERFAWWLCGEVL